jgi:hypothetical protein
MSAVFPVVEFRRLAGISTCRSVSRSIATTPETSSKSSTCRPWSGYRRSGQVDKARLFFEKLHGYANHLGLYAEELDPAGRFLGNYPQAFTHLALINSALFLDEALDRQRR